MRNQHPIAPTFSQHRLGGIICCIDIEIGQISQQNIRPRIASITERRTRQPFNSSMHSEVNYSVSLKVILQPFIKSRVLGMRRQIPFKHQSHRVTSNTEGWLDSNPDIT